MGSPLELGCSPSLQRGWNQPKGESYTSSTRFFHIHLPVFEIRTNNYSPWIQPNPSFLSLPHSSFLSLFPQILPRAAHPRQPRARDVAPPAPRTATRPLAPLPLAPASPARLRGPRTPAGPCAAAGHMPPRAPAARTQRRR